MSTLGNDLMVMHWEQNKLPTEGLVFYAPLASMELYANTGQELTYNPAITSSKFVTINGIPCIDTRNIARGDGYVAPVAVNTALGIVSRDCTVCIWEYITKLQNNNSILYMSISRTGTSPSNSQLIHSWNGYHYTSQWGKNNVTDSKVYGTGVWRHLAGSYSLSEHVVSLYVNGVLVKSADYTSQTPPGGYQFSVVQLGGGSSNGGYAHQGYLAATRIYDRALSASEIATLAHEFTPDQD